MQRWRTQKSAHIDLPARPERPHEQCSNPLDAGPCFLLWGDCFLFYSRNGCTAAGTSPAILPSFILRSTFLQFCAAQKKMKYVCVLFFKKLEIYGPRRLKHRCGRSITYLICSRSKAYFNHRSKTVFVPRHTAFHFYDHRDHGHFYKSSQTGMTLAFLCHSGAANAAQQSCCQNTRR